MANLKNTIINDTGFLKFPSGSNNQRPDTPDAGYTRMNTETNQLEIYDGTQWKFFTLESIPPVYNVTDSTTTTDEGTTITFTVTTQYVEDGTTLYYTLSGVDSNDVSTPTSGNFTINNNSGSVDVSITNDEATEGSETLTFQVRVDSTVGEIVTTDTTNINDTSVQQLALITDGLQMYLDAGISDSYGGSGTTWYDISGNNRHVTWNSIPSHTSGDAGYFATSGKTAIGPASNSFGIDNSSGYTIIMVFQTNSFSPNGAFKFRSSSAGSSTSRGIFSHPSWTSGTLYFDQGGCCNSDQRITYSSISTNTWYMVGFRSTVSTRSILLNGSGVVSNTTTNAANINLSSDTLLINPNDESYTWNGDLAIFAVYNRGISNSEFTQNYNSIKDRFGI